jgi:chemotaxis protein MotA
MVSTVSDTEARAEKPGAHASGPRVVLDLATLVGLVGVIALIVSVAVLGGSPESFVNLPSMLIVFGGTFLVTTICFTWPEVLQAQRMLPKALSHTGRDPSEAAIRVLELAVLARKKGVLALQRALPLLEGEHFLHKALSMVVDGFPADAVDQVMRSELHAMVNRHDKGASVLRKAAEVAPVMGLIGTLVGLVQMLGRLDDPSSIGPAMAVALLTTFYGAILGNMVLAPLATKLERNSGEEATVNNIYLLAAVSIGRQENPRRLELLLNTVLPPAKRVRYFR